MVCGPGRCAQIIDHEMHPMVCKLPMYVGRVITKPCM